jgi:hypothetical protein
MAECVLYQPIQRVAPYGIFPFAEQSCFDLITGEIAIHTTLNLRQLQACYHKYGLELELYAPITDEDIKTYRSASIGEKKKLLSRYDLIVRDDQYTLPCSQAHFCPIFVEFLHEDTIVDSDRQSINLLKTSNIADDTTGFYCGYGNEKRLWR